jgi:hypothetical protein
MWRMADWRGADVDVAVSAGGVLVLASPWDNVVRTGVGPWPPPELIQKLRTYLARKRGNSRVASSS